MSLLLLKFAQNLQKQIAVKMNSPKRFSTIICLHTISYCRTVGFGFLSTFGRVAAMIGPQLVYAVSNRNSNKKASKYDRFSISG